MSVLFTAVTPLLELAAIGISGLVAATSFLKTKNAERTKEKLVRFTRGNVLVQRSILESMKDFTIDREEKLLISKTILEELDRDLANLRDENEKLNSELVKFVDKLPELKNDRFFKELAGKAPVREDKQA